MASPHIDKRQNFGYDKNKRSSEEGKMRVITSILILIWVTSGCSQKYELESKTSNLWEKLSRADYVLKRATITFTTQKSSWQVSAKKAEIFSQKNIALLEDLRIIYCDEEGQKCKVKAKWGKCHLDSQNLLLKGEVVIIGEKNTILRSEKVIWDAKRQKFSSPCRTYLYRGDDRITCSAFVADISLKRVKMEKAQLTGRREIK